jgi:sulfate adenylyltransferase (ADP) / ATP adenylyltransferase
MDEETGRATPGTLEGHLTEATQRALASGALRPIETEPRFVENGGVEFLVRVASNMVRKDRQAKREGVRPNPFLPYEEEMFVADISGSHVALLNKFNVIERHLLIVTREFVDQEELLDLTDFEALDLCLDEFPGLGFYNGGTEAGASQPHKHLQLIPLPMSAQGPATPIEPLLTSSVGRGTIETLSTLPFSHAFVRLERTAERDLELYRGCLDRLGIRPPAPYNLLVTRDWMLVVPRSREHFGEISINALGFAGSLFVRDLSQLRSVQEAGPMAVLRAVSESRP